MLLSVVFIFFSLIFAVYTCPDNCFCETYRAECHLRKCGDQLFTEVDFLVIYGDLCDNHRYILTDNESGTQILLKESTCGDIPNCRLIKKYPTISSSIHFLSKKKIFLGS